jgi:hypothetical protein
MTSWLIRFRVFGPSESRAPRPNPSTEGNDDDTRPGNTPARLALSRSGFQGTWGRLGGAAHGFVSAKLVPITQNGMPGGAFRYLPRKCRRYCQKRPPIGLMKTDGPNVHRRTQNE